jgi:hypothetical protein
MSMFKKAERKQSKLRLALCAPSGAGKTYSALLIAKGLGGSVAVIDTEHGSASLYSDICDFMVCPLSAPYSPEKYIAAIKDAEKAGFGTLIIDSLTHAWSGEGGILDLHDLAQKNQKTTNGFAAWRNVTPLHNELVNTMLQSKLHIIATMRTKVAYELQLDDRGKQKPVKMGMAPIQREGMDYEFTVVLDVSVDSHVASASKDRTRLFDGKNFVISEKTGQDLIGWLNSGISFEESEKIERERQNELIERQIETAKMEISHALTGEALRQVFAKHYKAFASDEQTQALLKRVYDEQKAKLEPSDPIVDELKNKLDGKVIDKKTVDYTDGRETEFQSTLDYNFDR